MIVLAQRFDTQVEADANIADEGKVGRICNTLVKFDRTLEFWVIGCDTTTYQAKWRWQSFKQVYLDRTIGTKQGLRSVKPAWASTYHGDAQCRAIVCLLHGCHCSREVRLRPPP